MSDKSWLFNWDYVRIKREKKDVYLMFLLDEGEITIKDDDNQSSVEEESSKKTAMRGNRTTNSY